MPGKLVSPKGRFKGHPIFFLADFVVRRQLLEGPYLALGCALSKTVCRLRNQQDTPLDTAPLEQGVGVGRFSQRHQLAGWRPDWSAQQSSSKRRHRAT
jgi:hypothetical protein